MDTTLTIRLGSEEKNKLEELARRAGITVSELLRKHIIPFARITETLETLKALEMLDKMLAKAIISMPEFQELLKSLPMESVVFCSGWDCEEGEEFEIVVGTRYATVVKREGDILVPAFIIDEGYDNTTGTMHYYSYSIKTVGTLEELAEWFDEVSWSLEERKSIYIKKVKEAIKRLVGK